MASIDRTPNGRWKARYREFPNGPVRSRTFDRKVDAQRFLVDVEHDLARGTYVSPKAGRTTVAEQAADWTSRRRRYWRPGTQDRVDQELRLHILPAFGDRPLVTLTRAHVERWAAELELVPDSVRVVCGTLSALLASAVEDGRIPRNPADGARLPKVEKVPVVPLTAEEVHRLAGTTPESFRAAIVFGATTGLRQGEAMAVTLDRLDFPRRRLRVDRQFWTPRGAPPVFAPPKGRRGYRTIALSGLTLDVLSAHIATFGTGEHGLVFHRNGAPIGRHAHGRRFRRAADRAGLADASWHDLRHHHASVLLSAGVSPALVAERLGHDIATLLRTYAHVIRSDEDRVRTLIDDTLGGSAVSWLCPEGVDGDTPPTPLPRSG